MKERPVRLGVRTPDFHSGNRGSIPLRATTKKTMANHKSALKRIRQNAKRNALNSYYHKTMRNALRTFRNSSDKSEVGEMLPKVSSMIDRLAKKNIIHKNKAANLKSSITKHEASL